MQEAAQSLSFFLRASSWKLFALQFVLPITGLALGMAIGSEAIFWWLFIAMTLIWGGVMMLWMVAVARASNTAVSVEKRRSTNLLEVGLVSVVIYLAVVLAVMRYIDPKVVMRMALLPHLVAMFALFYAMWFTAGQLAMVKNNGDSFAGRLGRFLLIWNFSIGIWFLQPEVRRNLAGVSA